MDETITWDDLSPEEQTAMLRTFGLAADAFDRK